MNETPAKPARKLGPLKPYGPDLADGHIHNSVVRELLGTPSHIRQFHVLTMALSKADAAERFAAALGPALFSRPSLLRERTGHAVEALLASGFLADNADALVYHQSFPGQPIVAVRAGEQPRVVGRFDSGPAGSSKPVAMPTGSESR